MMDNTPTTGQPPSPAPTPASHPGNISPALPSSPETQPTQAPPSAPAGSDPYARYAQLDYDAMLAEYPVEGMDARELATVYGPARETIRQFGAPGLHEALESSGAGSDANMLRSMAAINRDYQQLLGHVREMNRTYKDVSQQLGQPVTAINDPPPLTGAALERATQQFLTRYFPTSSAEIYARDLAHQPAVVQTLQRAVQEFSRLERSLEIAGQQRQQLQAQWDAPDALRQLPDGRRYTKAELQASYGELMQQFMAADRRGDLAAKTRLKLQLEKIGKAAFS